MENHDLGVINERGYSLIEFCRENKLVIATTLLTEEIYGDFTRWTYKKSNRLSNNTAKMEVQPFKLPHLSRCALQHGPPIINWANKIEGSKQTKTEPITLL